MPAKAMNSKRLVPFQTLYPLLEPQLDKDRAVQLRDLFARFRNGSIGKEEFVPALRTLVGDHMLKMVVEKCQTTRADNTKGLSGFPANRPSIQTHSPDIGESVQSNFGNTNTSSPVEHLTNDPQSLLVKQLSRASIGDDRSVLEDTDTSHHYHYHHHYYHHHHVMDTSQNKDNQLSCRACLMKSKAPNAMKTPSPMHVPFAKLYDILEPQLDKNSAKQLLAQYGLFMMNSINKDEFVQYMRNLVGEDTLKKASYKVATDLC